MADSSAPRPNSRWGNRILVVLFAAVLFPVGAALLYGYAPGEHTFYPRCMFFWATGLHCPGCGGTRCVHALLHLDFAQALAYNPLLVVFSPLLIGALFCSGYTMWTGKRVGSYRTPGWAVAILLGVLIAYWILRNIPGYPFELLAPHKL